MKRISPGGATRKTKDLCGGDPMETWKDGGKYYEKVSYERKSSSR